MGTGTVDLFVTALSHTDLEFCSVQGSSMDLLVVLLDGLACE